MGNSQKAELAAAKSGWTTKSGFSGPAFIGGAQVGSPLLLRSAPLPHLGRASFVQYCLVPVPTLVLGDWGPTTGQNCCPPEAEIQ